MRTADRSRLSRYVRCPRLSAPAAREDAPDRRRQPGPDFHLRRPGWPDAAHRGRREPRANNPARRNADLALPPDLEGNRHAGDRYHPADRRERADAQLSLRRRAAGAAILVPPMAPADNPDPNRSRLPRPRPLPPQRDRPPHPARTDRQRPVSDGRPSL